MALTWYVHVFIWYVPLVQRSVLALYLKHAHQFVPVCTLQVLHKMQQDASARCKEPTQALAFKPCTGPHAGTRAFACKQCTGTQALAFNQCTGPRVGTQALAVMHKSAGGGQSEQCTKTWMWQDKCNLLHDRVRGKINVCMLCFKYLFCNMFCFKYAMPSKCTGVDAPDDDGVLSGEYCFLICPLLPGPYTQERHRPSYWHSINAQTLMLALTPL